MNIIIEKNIQERLITAGKTLCTAESCTGGRIAALLTSVPGSSEYYRGGAVMYQTEIKELVLKVPREVIDTYGVVSSQTADAMRECACRLFEADYAITITGYAGPTGGTEEDPVGTVYISVGSLDNYVTKRVVSNGLSRNEIQDDVARRAVDLFLAFLDNDMV